MGQYYQPPPPGYGPQPHQMVPPEAQSIKSMCNIAGILALIAGILLVVVGIILIFTPFGWILTIFPVIAGVFWILFYMACKGIIQMVDARQYEQAKSKTMLWMIIGFIFGFWLGLILLIAYMKFDSLINATRAQAYAPPPQHGAPQPAPQQQRLCLGCGQQIPLNFNNCPHCGKQAVQPQPAHAQHGGMRMCLGCGQQIQSSYAVCPHCGKHMGQ
ncbi:MAG: zinc ribbon domain-containing protein [Thermoplasmata archaeon]|nr:zinc ribbon domain-containing protein [Thermoplasmata archaeon]